MQRTMKNITSNLIKFISNCNIYPEIKIEQAKKKKNCHLVLKTFDFFQNSSVPYYQVTFYCSISISTASKVLLAYSLPEVAEAARFFINGLIF